MRRTIDTLEKRAYHLAMFLSGKHAEPHVLAALLSPLLAYTRSLGIDQGQLFEAAGLSQAILDDPDARIPVSDYARLEEVAAKLSGDPQFGLHVGEYFEPGAWSILGFLLKNCRDMFEVHAKAMKYAAIISTALRGKYFLSWRGIKVVLVAQAGAPPLPRHCAESALSSSIRMLRELVGDDFSPLELRFKARAPDSDAEYRRVFRCPVLFDQDEDSMLLDTKLSTLPLRRPNPAMLKRFEAYADDYLASFEGVEPTARAATRHILASLDVGSLSIRRIAREMGMSVRTLQNRLGEEGLGFSGLLRDTRVRLAKRYLTERKPVDEITFLLGFSEPSAFRRAFKAWTGLTPQEFREGSASEKLEA